jgi:hypothetical protein
MKHMGETKRKTPICKKEKRKKNREQDGVCEKEGVSI